MRNIILGGLLLPLRLYFSPISFADEIAALAPDLPYDYDLWEAKPKFRDAAFRRGLARIIFQAVIALLWVPALAGLFSSTGYDLHWVSIAIGVAVVVFLCVAFSIAFGVAVSVTGVVAYGIAGIVDHDIAYKVAFGMVTIVTLVMLRGRALDRIRAFALPGDGLLGGVAGELKRFAVYVMVVAVMRSAAPYVARILGLQSEANSEIWITLFLAYAIAGLVIVSRWPEKEINYPLKLAGLAVAGIAVVIVEIGRSGASALVKDYLPALLVKDHLLALVMTGSVVVGLTASHLYLYLPQFLFCFFGAIIIRSNPKASAKAWRVSPVRWDEIILLPLPGLVQLLVTLNRTNPALGQEAIAKVAAHRFQRWAAQAALVRIAQEDAMLVTSLPALAAFERGGIWLTDPNKLPASLQILLPRMRDISRETASALESDSATNRVRRLKTAAELLESLRKEPGEFGAVFSLWSSVISTALQSAQQQQRVQEPIPQVYIKDGAPIRLAGRPDNALPFKGRTTLFRQLEAALGGKEGERATFVLYGQRRTGKTSALMQLPRRLGSRMIPAFLDLQSPKLGGANNITGLLGGIAEAVREEAQRHRGMLLPPIDRIALTNDPFPAFGHWLDLMENKMGERTLLLCLDEFEALEESISQGRFDTRILSTIRNIAQHRRRIVMLLSGSHQIGELPSHWASALITTTTLPISFLEQADARELIEHPVADFPSIYATEAIDLIIELTHCQPYLIQLTCALLVERMNAARRMPPASFVTKDDIETIIPVVLARGQNYFIDLWRTQTGGKLAQRVLIALSKAPGERLDGKAVRRIEPDEIALSEAINILLRREIIERADQGYQVVVPLVAAYVRQEIAV
jgi:hypothetical protein